MAGQQLYQERTGRAGIQMPGQVRVPAMPVDTRGAQAVTAIAGAAQQLGGILARQHVQDQRMRISESLLAARKEFSEWQAQYVQEHQGSNALSAGADFSAKMQEIAQRHIAAFGGAGNEIFQRELGGQMAALDLRASEQGAAYAAQQRRLWENSVLEGQKAQLLADAESDPGNGAWLDYQLSEYGRAIEARGMDATAPMQELASAVQLRRGLSWVQRGDLSAASALLQGWKSGPMQPWDISARYESGAEGSAAIGYDGTGGTSYGKFQLSSKQGSLDGFLRFLDGKGGEAAAVAQRLRAAGPADTGSKSGAMPEAWKQAAQTPGFAEWEHEFAQREFFDPAVRSLPAGAAEAVRQSPALQQMVWSTAVQHGAEGAAGIFKKVWRDGMTDADFVRAAYDERATRFGSSTPEVRASVQRRLRREADDILGGLSGAGGVNGMSLQAAMQLEGAIDRERSRQEREAAQQRQDNAVTLAQDITSQFSGLTQEEREAIALERVSTIEDMETRRTVYQMVSEHLKFLTAKEKTDTALRASDFAAQVKQQDLDPLTAIKTLKNFGLSGESAVTAMDRAFGKIEETPANRAALDELRFQIDRGAVKSRQEIEAAGFNGRMTDAQINSAISYYEQGGKLKGASLSSVDNLYKRVTGKSKMPEGFYDAVTAFLPDGKIPSEQELKKVISNLEMDGRVSGEWFGERLFEAIRDKEYPGWLPNLTDEEREEIAQKLREKGQPVTDRAMKEYKKAIIMGLPMTTGDGE